MFAYAFGRHGDGGGVLRLVGSAQLRHSRIDMPNLFLNSLLAWLSHVKPQAAVSLRMSVLDEARRRFSSANLILSIASSIVSPWNSLNLMSQSRRETCRCFGTSAGRIPFSALRRMNDMASFAMRIPGERWCVVSLSTIVLSDERMVCV